MRKICIYLAERIYQNDYKTLATKIDDIKKNYNFYDLRKRTFLLEQLLISGEDHRFRFHIGFDVVSILRALKNNCIYKKKEGASTISQQLVRVLIGDYRYSIKRKIKEIILAMAVEGIMPKRNIPICYLLVAYYGSNLFGLESIISGVQAGKWQDITLIKAAEIVARIKYPAGMSCLNERRVSQIKSRVDHLVKLHGEHRQCKYFSPYWAN